ncbi:MAG: mechanosensitive ion channel family protein [Planctomycetota bacterium]|nr:mechanosensitive ion channel family protein [Planctomycetota bacterium]
MLSFTSVFTLAQTENSLPPPPITSPVDALHSAWKPLQDLTIRTQDWLVTRGPGVLIALLGIVLAFMIAGWIRRLIIKGCTRAGMEITLGKFFGNLAKWGIIIFSFVTLAGTVGISTTGFAALIGAAGLAIGLALQGNLGNLAAGVLLLVFRPFKIGDSVIVAGQSGVVDGIDLFTTNLDTGDNRRIIIPNNAIFSGVIENQSHHRTRRVIVTVPVFAGAPEPVVREVLTRAAEKLARHPGAAPEPAPAVALAEIAPTYSWTIAVTARTPEFAAVREALLVELKSALADPRFASPAPMQNLYIKEVPARA